MPIEDNPFKALCTELMQITLTLMGFRHINVIPSFYISAKLLVKILKKHVWAYKGLIYHYLLALAAHSLSINQPGSLLNPSASVFLLPKKETGTQN